MPHVVNGIGTWYWGKSNIHGVKGTCEACGRLGELLSYDTRTYVVVLFVPIIPLNRTRVLLQCPSCKRHRTIKYKVWRQMNDVDLPAAIDAFRSSPRDRAKAEEAIEMSVACQNPGTLVDATAIAANAFANDAEVQGILGHAHAYFSNHEAAESAFRASLAAKEDDDIRNALSRNLLHQSRPDEAWELIAHDLKESSDMRGGLALLIAESYQSWGMHDAAQTVLDETIAALPQLEMDKDYKRLRKSATKHQGTDKKLKPKLLTPPTSLKASGRRWRNYVPMAVAAIIVFGGIALFTLSSWSAAAHREVHLVNGLSIPYRVSINGIQRNLRPMNRSIVKLAEGDIKVTVDDELISIPEQSTHISSSFFTRLFSDDIYVINPDRTALLFWEEAEYTERAESDADYSYAYHCGKLLHKFEDVDYPFQEFPDTISLPSGTPVHKSRVEFMNQWAASTTAGVLLGEVSPDVAVDYLTLKAELDVDDPVTIGTAVKVLPEERSMALLKKLCAIRPIRVEAHRTYQWLMDLLHPEVDVVPEYRELLEQAPEDAARIYLLARVMQDTHESIRLMEKAASAEPPCAHAYTGMAYRQMAMGEFEEAVESCKKAITLLPANDTIRYSFMNASAAAGRFQDALDEVPQIDRIYLAANYDEIYFYCRLGNRAKLDAYIEHIARQDGYEQDPSHADELRAASNFLWAYVDGDVAKAIAASESIDDPETGLARAIMQGNLKGASEILEGDPSLEVRYKLLVSMLLKEEGDFETANRIGSMAYEQLSHLGSESRVVADWLTGKSSPNVDDVLQVNLPPNLKAVVLVAMAERQPDHGGGYLELAEKLNFDKRFPYLTIQELIKSMSGAARQADAE